jgi:hypothetical protein
MTTLDQDILYQYSDGRDLLSAILMERDLLLRELEEMAQAPQGTVNTEHIVRFDLLGAQALLFDLSIITEKIDALMVEINGYAEKSGKPRVEIIATK